MASISSFSDISDSMPQLVTLEQARLLIAAFLGVKSINYGQAQQFVHRHRVGITTPASRAMAPSGLSCTKNRNKAYIYKNKLAQALNDSYGCPPRLVDSSVWMPFNQFVRAHIRRFPRRTHSSARLASLANSLGIPLLYSRAQHRLYKTQFIQRDAAMKILG